MGVNKFNCEGYYDPTAYEALTKIEQEAKALRAFRPVVYICSPLAGDMVKNQENARTYCRFAVEAGCVPIAPHIYFTQFMNDNDRSVWVFCGGLPLVAKSCRKFYALRWSDRLRWIQRQSDGGHFRHPRRELRNEYRSEWYCFERPGRQPNGCHRGGYLHTPSRSASSALEVCGYERE